MAAASEKYMYVRACIVLEFPAHPVNIAAKIFDW